MARVARGGSVGMKTSPLKNYDDGRKHVDFTKAKLFSDQKVVSGRGRVFRLADEDVELDHLPGSIHGRLGCGDRYFSRGINKR
jgi:hypothetical protein